MRLNRFVLTLGLTWGLLVGVAVPSALAAAGRMKGVVADSSGEPLGSVVITIRGLDYEFEKVTTTKKNGKFSLSVTNADRAYAVRLEKEGYVTIEEPVKLSTSQILETEWVLYSTEEQAEHSSRLQQIEAHDKATKAYNLGAAAYNAGDDEAAITHFRDAVESNPDFDVAHAALARLYLQAGKWLEAREVVEAFLRSKPEDPLGLQMLYDSYWGEGDAAKAEEVMARLLEIDSGPAVAARIFNQAVAATGAATTQEDWEQVRRGFTQALELDPSLYQALLPLAQIHFSRSEWQEAVAKTEAYLDHDASNARANIVRYRSYEAMGDTEVAASAFAALRENSPKAAAELLLRDATDLYNNGSVEDATKAIKTSLALDPDNPQAHYQMGLCYASAGENSLARASLEKFLEMAPDHPEAAAVREMLTYLQ